MAGEGPAKDVNQNSSTDTVKGDKEQSGSSAKKEVGKELCKELLDDTYFQYLMEQKVRSQTWAFLKIIGFVIGLILLYGGWEFKSAKDEIKSNTNIINKETANIKDSSQKIQETLTTIQQQKEDMTSAAQRTKEIADTSNGLSGSILQSAQASLENARTFMDSFAQQQAKLLNEGNQTFKNNFKALDDDLKKSERILKDLDEENIQKKLGELTAAQQTITEAKQQALELISQANAALNNVQGQIKILEKTKDVNYQLAKLGTTELLTLREHQTYMVRLPDFTKLNTDSIQQLSENITALPHYIISFKAEDVHKNGRILWKVRREGLSADGNWKIWDFKGIPTDEREAPRIQLTGTPYEAVIQNVYYGILSSEFVVLKIVASHDLDSIRGSSR